MDDQTIGGWLDDLASDKPVPGGGAAAALLVATGAALVQMVANLTIGKPRYAVHEPLMIEVRDRAAAIQHESLGLGAEDEAAYLAVIAAYRISKDDPSRAQTIRTATLEAAKPPLRTARLAAEVIWLAAQIRTGANVNVISDVAVAAASARAALESAAVSAEINLSTAPDPELSAELAAHLSAAATAEETIAAVRETIGG